MEFVNPEGLRLDGRRPRELRQLRCEIGLLAAPDGSASFEMGNTRVVASVWGPHPAQRHLELSDRAVVTCEYAMAAFSTGERRRRRTDRRTAELSAVIRNTMEQAIMVELLPRSQVDIFVQVIQADGGTRCACINAAMLALADAGIPCRDMVAACAAGYLDSTVLLDLNYQEDSGGGPDVAMAMLANRDKVVLLQTDCRLQVETLEQVADMAGQGCKAVAQFMRGELMQHMQKLALLQASAPS